jgi:thiol-disulfide isomerase/thioredoxin
MAVPEVAAAVVPLPGVGDTPSVAFVGADGKRGTLAELHGAHTVVHFWATWCIPCKHQLPALRGLRERFASRGLTTVSLSLDEDPAAWQESIKNFDLPWQQYRLDGAKSALVSTVPTYWLLDQSGKIVAKAYDPDELAAALADRLK